MISYGKQSIDESDIASVLEVLSGDWLTQGPAVEAFEDDIQDYFGARHACAVANGTAALHLVGLALDWRPGDIVITTPITFLATANCIAYAGATPDFVDIDPKTYTINLEKLEKKIGSYKKAGKNIKAVIGVDYAGHPCDWVALRKLADKYDFQLINDNCHAMGASLSKRKQYATQYADVVVQSYHPVKNITTGEGGAVLTNISAINEKVKKMRSHGMVRNVAQMENNDGPWYYEMHDLGFNYRITDFQCALGSNQLKKLDGFIQKRQAIARYYDASFAEYDELITPCTNQSIGHAHHLYPLQINFENISVSKKELFTRMKEVGISLQVHYIPVHLQPYYRITYGFKFNDFPISEKFYKKEVSLPIYPNLSRNEMHSVVNCLLEIIT